MMHPFHALLVLFALAALAALVVMLRYERRYFSQRGQGGAWLAVRIATVPIALATAALIIVPSTSISGAEALAVFYFMLLIVAPAFWFGAHWMVGRFTRPQLRFNESGLIAGTPIALALGLVSVAHALQPFAWMFLRNAGLV